MDGLSNSINALAEEMQKRAYEYFNFPDGRIGVDFKTGLQMQVRNYSSPEFPVYATTAILATSPDEPYGIARFCIAADKSGSLQVTAIELSLYENFDGGLRTSLTLEINSSDSIPSKEQARHLLEKSW